MSVGQSAFTYTDPMTDQSPTLQRAPKARPLGRSERVGDAVLAATIKLLSESGAQKLSLEKVAKEAGVNRTTLYRRWGNKSRLITWAMLEHASTEIPQPDTGAVISDVVELMMAVDAFFDKPFAPVFFQIASIDARHDPAIAAAVRDYWAGREALAGKIFERGIARGELPEGFDYMSLAEQVFGPFYYRLMTGRRRATREELTELVESFVDKTKA